MGDISLARYDIRLTPHDIFAYGKYDIISVPLYAERISSAKQISYSQGISPVPWGTDIIVKSLICLPDKSGFFLRENA